MSEHNEIDWSKDYLLEWSDFQREVNIRSIHVAESSIKYWATYTIVPDNANAPTKCSFSKIQLIPQFQKNFSWVRKQDIEDPKISALLLKHEQGHFDLAEELRPQIIEKIQNELMEKEIAVRGTTEVQMMDNAKKDAEVLMMISIEKWKKEIFDKARVIYDVETKHGVTIPKQEEYNKRFNKLRE